ncbi:MAG: hypothetical protein ACK5WZ_08310 [Pseudobdellovibrionaceae bacterium]
MKQTTALKFLFLSFFISYTAVAQVDQTTQTAASASSAITKTSTTDSTTSSATLERSTWLDKTSVNLYSFASVGVPEMEKGDASIFSYNYVAFNYKISKDRRISFRPTFNYVSGGLNRFGDQVGEDVVADDFHIVYNNYDLGELAGSEISGNVRLYLPTGKNSQAQRMIAKTRAEVFFEWGVRQFSSLSYGIKADLLFHNERTYRNQDIVTDNRGLYVSYPIQANRFAVLEHFLSYEGSISNTFSFEPQIGFKEEWRYRSDVEGIDDSHPTSLKSAAALKVNFSKDISVKVFLENQTRIDGSAPFTYGRPSDNSWLLETYIRL